MAKKNTKKRIAVFANGWNGINLDGALKDSSTTTFVRNSAAANIATTLFSIRFDAYNKATA